MHWYLSVGASSSSSSSSSLAPVWYRASQLLTPRTSGIFCFHSQPDAEGEGDKRSVRIFTIQIRLLCLTIFCHLWRDFASADVLIYTLIIETFIQFMLIYFQEGWREGWISAPVLNFDKPRQVPSWDAGGREGRAWMTDITPKHSPGSWIITRPR